MAAARDRYFELCGSSVNAGISRANLERYARSFADDDRKWLRVGDRMVPRDPVTGEWDYANAEIVSIKERFAPVRYPRQ